MDELLDKFVSGLYPQDRLGFLKNNVTKFDEATRISLTLTALYVELLFSLGLVTSRVMFRAKLPCQWRLRNVEKRYNSS